MKLINGFSAIGFILVLVFNGAEGLKCYTCSATSTTGDLDKCINDPAKVEGRPITSCNKKYCTIVREELLDPPDTVKSISRDCTDEPVKLDEVIEDDRAKYFYRSCETDLCNNWDGVYQGINVSTPDRNGGPNILAEGLSVNSAANHVQILTKSLSFLLLLLITMIF